MQGQYGVLDTYLDGVSRWEGIMKFSENKFYDITLMTDNYTQEAATTLVGNFVSQFKQTYPNVNIKQVNELTYGLTDINNNIHVVISLNEFNGSYLMVIRFVDLSI